MRKEKPRQEEPCEGEEKGRTSDSRGVDAGGIASHAAAIASVQRRHASAPGEGFRATAPRRGLLRRDAAIVSVGRHTPSIGTNCQQRTRGGGQGPLNLPKEGAARLDWTSTRPAWRSKQFRVRTPGAWADSVNDDGVSAEVEAGED